jgi:uncharacterized membrane protein
MTKGRVEAFSDGVIAVLITILVLELELPHEGTSLESLRPLFPTFTSYVLSFVFLAIYWNNHHHLMHVVKHIDGASMWANAHLLFWLSLVPATTAWMGTTHYATTPVALYGTVLFMSAVAFTILVRRLCAPHVGNAALVAALGSDRKGWVSLALYATAIPMAFIYRWIAVGIYVLVAAIWLVPDSRIERRVPHEPESAAAD